MPKDMCMKACEKIAEIQQLQYVMRTPPYACNDDSDTFDGQHELSFVLVSSES